VDLLPSLYTGIKWFILPIHSFFLNLSHNFHLRGKITLISTIKEPMLQRLNLDHDASEVAVSYRATSRLLVGFSQVYFFRTFLLGCPTASNIINLFKRLPSCCFITASFFSV